MVERLHRVQADRGAEHAGDLRVVAARVRGARHRIRLGMAGHPEPIELADDREAGPAPLRAGGNGLDAGHRKPRLRRETEAQQCLLDERRGLRLLESELGKLADALADSHDGVRALIDRAPHLCLELVLRHG